MIKRVQVGSKDPEEQVGNKNPGQGSSQIVFRISQSVPVHVGDSMKT